MSRLPIFKNAGKALGKASEGAREIGRGLRKAGLDDVADDLIELSPVGGYWKAIKGLGRILGLGDNAPESAIAEAMASATPDQKAQIAELMVREKEAAYADLANERDNITARHANDMLSDNWLSKMLRPSVCVGLNAAAVAYSFAVLFMVFLEVTLLFLGEMGKVEFSNEVLRDSVFMELAKTALTALWTAAGSYNLFYVGGRTFEKRGSFFAAAQAVAGR